MDEETGSIVDHQGNNTGTATGTTSSASKVELGRARSFTGGDDISLGNKSLVDNLASVSVSAWIQPTAQTANTHFRVFSEEGVLYVGQYGTQVSMYMGNGIWQATSNTMGALTINAWNHVVWVKNGTTATVYVNGAQTGTVAAPATLGTTSQINYISTYDGTNQPWNGYIDELGIWKRALTAAEVTNLYNSTRGYQLRNNAYVIDTSGGSGRVQASMYLGTLGMRWYRDPNSSYLYQYSADNAVTGTQYLLNTGASTGFVYGKNTGTDTGFGLLTNGGAWALRIPMSGTVIDIPGDVRTPRFYDYNNTSYYVDPATTSVTDVTEATQICLNGDCRTVWPGQ
jgi:hypothetical protein